MVAAHMAGISIFVTGGLGGVHRNASKTFDVSADLTELGRTPVALICAGGKSILDIGLTLEYLETQGVPVIKYGKSNLFPSFFTPASDFKVIFPLLTFFSFKEDCIPPYFSKYFAPAPCLLKPWKW